MIGGLRRFALPLDTAERHRLVARLASPACSVLDVGGVAGQLAAFLPDALITTINVSEAADVRFDGRVIPYPDRSFDVVTSLDVLEHVDPLERFAHMAECARVAARRVVLSCPLGTPAHEAAERTVAEWYQSVSVASTRSSRSISPTDFRAVRS
jgi:hypothetical protein